MIEYNRTLTLSELITRLQTIERTAPYKGDTPILIETGFMMGAIQGVEMDDEWPYELAYLKVSKMDTVTVTTQPESYSS